MVLNAEDWAVPVDQTLHRSVVQIEVGQAEVWSPWYLLLLPHNDGEPVVLRRDLDRVPIEVADRVSRFLREVFRSSSLRNIFALVSATLTGRARNRPRRSPPKHHTMMAIHENIHRPLVAFSDSLDQLFVRGRFQA